MDATPEKLDDPLAGLDRISHGAMATTPWFVRQLQSVRQAQGSEPVEERGCCGSNKQSVVGSHSVWEIARAGPILKVSSPLGKGIDE
jgi:hypothetical protein